MLRFQVGDYVKVINMTHPNDEGCAAPYNAEYVAQFLNKVGRVCYLYNYAQHYPYEVAFYRQDKTESHRESFQETELELYRSKAVEE
jgi:hypothetical protein